MSGAQRDFLLAGLWKEQEIPRWRCERKTLFPEEVAGVEARADTESEWHHPVCLTRVEGGQGGGQLPSLEDGPGRSVSGLPVAGSSRAGSILKQDTNMLNQRHADQLYEVFVL